MTRLFKAIFLFSSFAPLYFLLAIGLAVQRWDRSEYGLAGTFGVWIATLLLILSYFAFIYLRRGLAITQPMREEVSSPQAADESVLSYMLSYIPPLLIDDFSNPEKSVPAICFYIVLIIMMGATQTIYVNPYFLLSGCRIFKAKISGKPVTIITTRDFLPESELITLHEIGLSSLYYAPKDES